MAIKFKFKEYVEPPPDSVQKVGRKRAAKSKTLYRVRIFRRAISGDNPSVSEVLIANDESLAVSPEKALNNVRYRCGLISQYYEYDYGRTSYDYTWKVENTETGNIELDTTSRRERQ